VTSISHVRKQRRMYLIHLSRRKSISSCRMIFGEILLKIPLHFPIIFDNKHRKNNMRQQVKMFVTATDYNSHLDRQITTTKDTL